MALRDEIVDILKPWIADEDERMAVAVLVEQASSPNPGGTGIWSDNHALLVGRIMGDLMMDAGGNGLHPLQPEPIMSGENYTNRIVVTQPSGRYVVTVDPG